MKVLDPKFVNRWAFALIGSLVIHIVAACYFFSGSMARAPAPDPVDANASVTTEPNATAEPAAKPEATDPAPPADEGTRPARPTARPPRPNANARNTAPAAAANTPSAATDAAAPKTKTYRVKKGDNLTHIARDCGSTPAELAKLNGVSEKQLANLKIGQVIKVPADEE